ncbi:hypothetical protein PAMC26510_11215 [Caballeronia sordidicola]|uniref:Uncharacterized protein n=1 Tax=Caballeronia sordidicola TaxID=196367 RepID=A0A242MZV7_CABSO|nr:hypothetical protein PAMC26510_11215 [Caballeronia sordidicola]
MHWRVNIVEILSGAEQAAPDHSTTRQPLSHMGLQPITTLRKTGNCYLSIPIRGKND